MGPAWDTRYNLVFCLEIGRPIDANNLRKRHYYPLLAKAGLRRITFHDLRHSFTTHLRTGTNDKHVSDFVGHASTDQTDTYTHLTPDAKAAMVSKIAQLFWA
jgi:integrase